MNSVVLADDHPLLLRGLCDLLDAERDFAVVGAGVNGKEALSLIRKHKPTLAVIDVTMPELSGLEILQAVRVDCLRLKMIFLTATITGSQIAEALRLEVSGILLKESAPHALIDCMRQVAGGGKWLPAELVEKASHHSQGGERLNLNKLSPREKEIVGWVCNGLSNKSIALKLGTTDGTVKVHLHNIYQKLDISNRMTLAAFNFRAGIC